jgi:hypothetical protein
LIGQEFDGLALDNTDDGLTNLIGVEWVLWCRVCRALNLIPSNSKQHHVQIVNDGSQQIEVLPEFENA